MTKDYLKELNYLKDNLKDFTHWACKAKFKYITSNRFVEFAEIKDTIDSKFNAKIKYTIDSINANHIESETGHIKLDFKIDETKLSDDEINEEYKIFFNFILLTFEVIEREFVTANIAIPDVEIVLLNAFNQEIKQITKNQLIEIINQ